MKTFERFLAESAHPQFSVASFPKALENNPKIRQDRLATTLETLNAALVEGRIYNPVFVNLKSDVNRFLESALDKPEWLYNAVWRENREKAGFTLYDLDNSIPYANTLAGKLKKAKAALPKAQSYGDKTFLGWLIPILEELTPLADAFLSLKDKVYKKEPKAPEDRQAKYIAPMAAHETGKLILSALRKITDQMKDDYAKSVTAFYIGVAESFNKMSGEEQRNQRQHSARDIGRLWNHNAKDEHGKRAMRLVDDYKTICKREGEQAAEDMQQEFILKNAKKLAAIAEGKGVGLVAEPESKNLHIGSGTYEGELDFKFTDGSKFTVRNKVIWKRSVHGKLFNQYPTTFHDVVLPDGSKMSAPSEERMVTVFATTKL